MDTEPHDISLEPPFRINSDLYTSEELQKLREFFMADNYDSFTIRSSPRDGYKKFESLPVSNKSAEYQDLISKTVSQLLYECHPLLRRRNIIARFVPKISEDQKEKEISPGAECLDAEVDGEKIYWIRVSLENVNEMDDENLIPNLAFRVLHEIAETDYYLKSLRDTQDPKDDPNSAEYPYSEDEEITNRRVLKILKQFYPEANFIDIDYKDL